MNQQFLYHNLYLKLAERVWLFGGFLKSGVLKSGMFTEIKKQKINIIGIEVFNKKMEEVRDIDPVAKSLAIVVSGNAEKNLADYINQELIFIESK